MILIKRFIQIICVFILSLLVIISSSEILYNSTISDEEIPLGSISITEQMEYINNAGESIKTGNSYIDDKISTSLWINVKDYGAMGNGLSDDTSNIQKAINDAAESNRVVFIPKGEYLINADKSLNIKSNTIMIMDIETILHAIPSKSVSNSIIAIIDVSDIYIIGGVLEGDRYRHLNENGEWGMGIRILGANKIFIKNTKSNHCWGDGYYIGSSTKQNFSKDISLINVEANNNRRHNITLISGSNIKITQPKLINADGFILSAGIDIEPNDKNEVLENIEIIDPSTENNAVGLQISTANFDNTSKNISINISNHIDNGSGIGMNIYCRPDIIKGSLNVEKPTWNNNGSNGLLIQNHNYYAYSIRINEPNIVNSNSKSNFTNISSSALAIVAYPSKEISDYTSGNVHIVNPNIDDNRIPSKLSYGIYVSKSKIKFKQVNILHTVINGIENKDDYSFYSPQSEDLIISYKNQ